MKINDFVIKFANVNGSGSASANSLFAKAVFRMGVPVSPKNIFPSNIQGLPTWFEVRVNGDGYLGRREGIDLMVAMNPQSWADDVASIVPGGYLLYDSTFIREIERDDIKNEKETSINYVSSACLFVWTPSRKISPEACTYYVLFIRPLKSNYARLENACFAGIF